MSRYVRLYIVCRWFPSSLTPQCDEKWPSCRSCDRYLAPCIYPHQTRRSSASDRPQVPSKGGGLPSGSLGGNFGAPANDETDASILGLEADQRRKWELKLLHNYMTCATGRPPQTTLVHPDSVFDWGLELSRLALTDDCILHGLLAHSALHMRLTCSHDGILEILPQKYFTLALRLHRRAAGNITSATAEGVGFASLVILMHLFALVQTLPRHAPPLEWLSVGRGVGTVMLLAREKLGAGSALSRFLQAQAFDRDTILASENRHGLLWLIEPVPGDTEPDDAEAEHVYLRVLSYLGYARTVMAHDAKRVKRALASFAIWAPDAFRGYLADKKPRALAIMAYFFAMCTTVEHLWVVGAAGRRQLQGIQEALPATWQGRFRNIQSEVCISRPRRQVATNIDTTGVAI